MPPRGQSIGEVQEIIEMPSYNANVSLNPQAYRKTEIDRLVVCELREYVAGIAKMYRDNNFHNFNRKCCPVQISFVGDPD